MTVRLRFAPSPTGYLHIGSVWTALFGWMYVQRHGGQFILRIEDTDTQRTVDGALENLMEGLRWFGINWDEGPDIGGPHAPYIQTERAPLYQKWAHWLLENGHAYKCFATAEELAELRRQQEAQGDYSGYDRRYRNTSPTEVARLEAEGIPYVIRFKMPLEGTTIMPDLLRGDITYENKLIADPVLLKSNGLPTYHLAVVVDDHAMGITHVTRGVEWLGTAPLHIQLYNAFGWDMPVWVHFPVLLNPNGKGKLSKRKEAYLASGEKVLVRADEFEAAGYLPYAIVNLLTNVGWSFGNDIEKFTPAQAIERFDLADVNPTPVQVPYGKLDWLNGQYIQELSPEALLEAITPYLHQAGYEVDQTALLPLMAPLSVRLKKLADAIEALQFFYADWEMPPLAKLSDKKLSPEAALSAFTQTRDYVRDTDDYSAEAIKTALFAIGESHTTNSKAGPFLGKARLAVTGQKVSPPLFECMIALGREKTLERLDAVVDALSSGN